MNTLNFITELWGIFMVIVPLALLCNQGLIRKIFAFADDDLVIFFGGILTFIIGVASILSHNIWSANWGLIITILGWVAIIKGITLLFWPAMARKMNDKMRNKEWMPYLLLVAIFIGCFLVYAGFILK